MIGYSIRRMWHVLAKIIAFILFGIGGLLLTLGIFPAIRILSRPQKRFRYVMRLVLSKSFSLFSLLLQFMGVVRITCLNPDKLRDARRMIICANHPSLIDVVLLIGMIPLSDCIVKAKLWSNPFVQGVVRNVYIPNSLSPADTMMACERSFEEGNNLVLFPEGTWTVPGQVSKFHRSAARIALRTGRPILPVKITIPDPRGMEKGGRLFSSPRDGVLRFTVEVLDPISPDGYMFLEEPVAARHLTDYLQSMLN